jgi:tripartite ATP-independent transporter DctM subunit
MNSGVWIFMFIFVVFILLDFPIAFAMLFATLVYCFQEGIDVSMFAQVMSNAFSSFTMLAIPTFIFVGSFMNEIGFSDDIFEFAKSLLGHIKGGLAHANVLASMIFAGMSGSAIADAGGLGAIEVKTMRNAGYDEGFAAAITAASAGLGPIIPPSISFVIYGSLTSISILALFEAGFIPGLIMGVSLMIMNYVLVKMHPALAPVYPKAPVRDVWKYLLKSLPAFVAPVILIGGMSGGAFTATEAGVVASVYVFVLALIYRKLTWKALYNTFKSTLSTTTMVLFMMGAGQIFNWMITTSGLMSAMLGYMMALHSKFMVLLILDLILLFMGCFMGGTSILILMTPFLISLSARMGFDLVHLGVVLVLATMIGGITPPMSPALFTTCKATGISFEKSLKYAFIFLVPLIVTLAALTFIPETVTILPKLLGSY